MTAEIDLWGGRNEPGFTVNRYSAVAKNWHSTGEVSVIAVSPSPAVIHAQLLPSESGMYLCVPSRRTREISGVAT